MGPLVSANNAANLQLFSLSGHQTAVLEQHIQRRSLDLRFLHLFTAILMA